MDLTDDSRPVRGFPSAAWINLNRFVRIDSSAGSKQGGRLSSEAK